MKTSWGGVGIGLEWSGVCEGVGRGETLPQAVIQGTRMTDLASSTWAFQGYPGYHPSCQTGEGMETDRERKREREREREQGVVQEVSWANPGSGVFGWNSPTAP